MSPEKAESLVSRGKANKQPNLHSRIPKSKQTSWLGVPLKMGSSGNANRRILVINLLEADSQCLYTTPVRWLSFDHLCRRLEESFKEKIKQRGLWTEEEQAELRGGHYAGNIGNRARICEHLHTELETLSLLSRMLLPRSILPGQQIWKTSPVTPSSQRGKDLKILTLKVLQGYAGRPLLGSVTGSSGPMCCVCLIAELCPTLWGPMDCSLPGSSVHGDSPGKNTGVSCHALLHEIFPTQGLNPGLPHCRQILYHLSHQESPWHLGSPDLAFNPHQGQVGRVACQRELSFENHNCLLGGSFLFLIFISVALPGLRYSIQYL